MSSITVKDGTEKIPVVLNVEQIKALLAKSRSQGRQPFN